MVNYDMHIHSIYSDGNLTVEEIINICKSKSLKGFSITDHDTTCAYDDEAILKEKILEIIPGIEISTLYEDCEVHILGYYIDSTNHGLQNALNKMKEFRLNRLDSILHKLNNIGYKITKNNVLDGIKNKNVSIGRPHIAKALVNLGYFKNTKDVFNKVLGNGKPAFVSRFKLSPLEGISLIKSAGGVPILAHPCVSKTNKVSDFKAFLNDMVTYGIKGLEVYHSLHTKLEEGFLLNYAIKNNLLITGGSDCHNKFNSLNEIVIGTKGINDIEKLKNAR